jgi:hypothetical protein
MVYRFIFHVPSSEAEAVKEAVFAAGGGRIGKYDSCCWQTEGSGQFRPLAGSNPAVGEHGRVERIPETKIEFICRRESLGSVVEALLKHHPYETPAYCYWPVEGVEV